MDNMEGLNQHKVNKFRSLITQVLAALSSAVIMFNLAEMNALMSVVNSELRRDNGTETFTITKNQASWYSSLHNLMHIAGSLLAGYLQECCGRKGCMLFGVIPQVIGCALLLYSTQPMHLYLSSISIGIGAALGEVPIATYISETASSRLRGRLFFFTKFGYGLGALFMFFLSNYVKWRNLALISAACPLITACYLLMLPETPSWLLSKGRHQDALESLSWLRGWAPTTLVSEEFAKLQQYVRESKNLGKSKNKYLPVATKSETEESNQKNQSWNGFKVLLTHEFLQPYKIVTATFFLSYILSLKAVKPYLIIILERFKVKVNSKNILAISSAAQILGAVTMVLTVNLLGKRKLIFWTFTGSSICIALFGLYSLLHSIYGIEQGWILYVIFITIYYLTGYAIGGMPWYICGEIYPQKIRGMASGISATTGYIMIFALTKTYFDMEKLFEMPNLFFFYAIIGIAGTIYLYYSLPETENKTLEEIEKVFQSRKKSKDELDREFTNRSRNKSSNILRTMICYPVSCFSHSSSKVIATGDANRVTGKSQES